MMATVTGSGRQAALAKADRRRMAKAELRRELARMDLPTGAEQLAAIVLEAPGWLSGAYTWQLIQAVRGVGDIKLRRIMKAAGIDPWNRFGRLTVRQRLALATELRVAARVNTARK